MPRSNDSVISAIRAKRLELARIDPRGGMPIMPPPGASPSAIAAAERRLGFALPPSYRAFLAVHDGWPKVFHGASLLGTQHLARGTFVAAARITIEEHIAPHEAMPGGFAAAFVPFGLDSTADLLFAWNTARARADGEIEIAVWVNEVGEVVDSFPAFLDLLLEMLAADVIAGEERREERRAMASGGSWAPPRARSVPVPAPVPARMRAPVLASMPMPAAPRADHLGRSRGAHVPTAPRVPSWYP